MGQTHIFGNSPEYDDYGPGLVSKNQYQMCNFIATLLPKIEEQHPGAFKDFFNPAIKTFNLIRDNGDPWTTAHLSFMIWRKENEVLCGHYETYKDKSKVMWENLTRSMLSNLAPNASRTTIWGARAAHSKMPVESFWQSGFSWVNQPHFGHCKPYESEEMEEVARSFTMAIWADAPWVEGRDAVFIVEMQTENISPIPQIHLVP